MPSAEPIFHTAAMARALNGAPGAWPRHETVHGELLVTPAPRPWHQEVVARLLVALRSYVASEPGVDGHAFGAPADIAWDADTLVQPDVFVVSRSLARLGVWPPLPALLLAAEVLSPGSARADRFTKRRLYQEAGVPVYWVVDADAGRAERWTPADRFPVVETAALEWHPSGAGAPFALSLAELLRPI